MDAPPYGRAVSDAPPHSGLSPIAVFRHYSSRHLICIVPFTRRGPSHPRALPRFPATMASSDYCFCSRYSQSSRVPLLNFPDTRPSYTPPRPRVQNRFGRTASASQRQNCWPRGMMVTRLYEEGSFALRLTSLSGRTPAHGSPHARPAVLITSRFVCDSCSFHHDSSAKLILAYLTP